MSATGLCARCGGDCPMTDCPACGGCEITGEQPCPACQPAPGKIGYDEYDDEPCCHDCDDDCYDEYGEWRCDHQHCFNCGGCGCPGYCDDFVTYNLRPSETGGQGAGSPAGGSTITLGGASCGEADDASR